jgi:tetratricopeptide (TPR) repeat protein
MSEDVAAAPETSDPTALSLALAGASRVEADAFLRDQRHHLHEQLKQIHLDLFERWLGVALRLATLLVGLAVAGGAIWVVREAYQADGLRVEPFSVPPDLAANGLTGQVVAARLIDRLSELQSQTNTGRPARTYSNSWGDKTIKLEIPETGVSLEEVDSWLRAKLGHETSLSGEVVRTGSGIMLTARAGTDGAVSVTGAETDMTALTDKLAEAVYRLTQPYRYAVYLMRHESRPADAAPIFRQLALNGNAEERQWSYNMWANATEVATHDYDLGLRMYRKAHQADPDAIQPMSTLGQDLSRFGRVEEARQINKEAVELQRKNAPSANVPDLDPGNFIRSLASATARARNGVRGLSKSVLVQSLAQAELNLHEIALARADLAELPVDVDLDPIEATSIALEIGGEMEDWQGVVAHAGEMTTYLKIYPRNRHYTLVTLAPLLAFAHAQLGDFAAAERLIAPMPADCEPCTEARGWIAQLQHQRARADFWFTRAVRQAPSLPFAFDDWGRALLVRGEPDAAIDQFKLANARGPHFANPLEGWGEALMAKNQSHLALAKFAEAEKYAPNWGRLHLKWGEALVFSGKPADAKAQFARAATLDLAPSEKAELARDGHG